MYYVIQCSTYSLFWSLACYNVLTFPFSILKQGLDDRMVPPSMTEYIERVLPEAVIHKLPNEGHFSYFFFCDECHKQIFSTLFGTPQGPFERQEETMLEKNTEDALVSVSDIE